MSINTKFRDKTVLHLSDDRHTSRLWTACCSILVVFLLFCFFRRLSPFVYQTNDDLFLRMVASGEISGTPESHLLHISYPTGLLLSGLYHLLPHFPWYGSLLCFTVAFSMIVILYSLLRSEKKLFSRLFTVFLFCLFSYGFLFYFIAELQYTVVTGIIGSSALFLFMLSSPSDSFRETVKNHSGFLLLSVYALCIRDQAFYMFFPFIGMIGSGKYLNAGKSSGIHLFRLNAQRKNLLALAGIFIAISASLLAIEKLAYHQEDWHTFSDYTESRISVYDYEGYPDYDAYEETYRELGLSRSSYEAASHRYCLILDPAINQHMMQVLENILKQERRESFLENFPEKVRNMAAFFWERHLSDADKPLNLLVYRCYFLFIICAVFSRKWSALRDILFTLFARMVIWSYLIFYGRLPTRVSQPIYLAELAVLFAIAFSYKLWLLRQTPGQSDRHPVSAQPSSSVSNTFSNGVSPKKNTAPGWNLISFGQKLCSAAWLLSLAIILYTCVRSGIPNAKVVAETAAARLQFSETFTVMKGYFKNHPDHFYYLDTNSFAYFTEDALEPKENTDSNYLFMGGWAAKSPWYEKKLKKEQIADPAAALFEDSSIYAVFMDTEETGYDYLEAFYAENYPGVRLEEVETIDTGDISFIILNAVQEETP